MDVAQQIQAIRAHAGVALRPEVRTLRLEGPDRVRFLDGMVSNAVATLEVGQGCVAIKPSNRGRIEGLVRVRCREESFDIDLLEVVAESVRKTLDMFIIMDDCVIGDVSSTRDVVTLLGPKADDVVAGLGVQPAVSDHGFTVVGELVAIRDRTLGVPGWELHVPAGQGAEVRDQLVQQGATGVSAEAFDVVRVESGEPIDGRDLDDDTIPMEARLERALSFDKGCYVGQEVIARGKLLGQVNHLLVGLQLQGKGAPPEDTPLYEADGERAIGELTSVVESPDAGLIAIGYVRRKFEATGTELVARTEGGSWSATVASLPFVPVK